jgi:metal-responsive CopG/Arc/MetJ family transcriptional regulator
MNMKTAISVPDHVFRTAEHFAREQKVSRSSLFTRAVEEFLAHHRREGVTERLNRVYASEDSALDPVLQKLQFASLPKERW